MSKRLERWAMSALLLGACADDATNTADAASSVSAADAAERAPDASDAFTPEPAPGTGQVDAGKADAGTAAAPPDAASPPDASTAAPPSLSMREPPEAFMADAGDGWKTLITGRWEVPSGEETYICVRFTVPEDLTIHAFRALSPPGTHHTFLSVVDEPTLPDSSGPCSASAGGARNIAGSGVGTDDFVMPEGVGIQVKAGQQLVLNLHLFNVTDAPIRGLSGTLIKLIDASEVEHYAEGIEAGTVSLNIPPGGPHKQTGTCTMSHDVFLIAAGPHMHQMGVYEKAVAHSSEMGDVVLFDEPYSFDEQSLRLLPKQVPMKKGDTISVECTYENPTAEVVKFGESTLEEMCFAGIYRYPMGSGSVICVR
jgi:hypothetical protein